MEEGGREGGREEGRKKGGGGGVKSRGVIAQRFKREGVRKKRRRKCRR